MSSKKLTEGKLKTNVKDIKETLKAEPPPSPKVSSMDTEMEKIEFAKMHVRTALKKASQLKTYGMMVVPLFNECQIEAILNCYPDNLIK